jgi:hypothetical protein
MAKPAEKVVSSLEGGLMGQLYDMREKIEVAIEKQGLDHFQIKGKISLKSGVFLSAVNPNTPDDTNKIQKLREAAKELLGIAI